VESTIPKRRAHQLIHPCRNTHRLPHALRLLSRQHFRNLINQIGELEHHIAAFLRRSFAPCAVKRRARCWDRFVDVGFGCDLYVICDERFIVGRVDGEGSVIHCVDIL
jgi:hypothetical protein